MYATYLVSGLSGEWNQNAWQRTSIEVQRRRVKSKWVYCNVHVQCFIIINNNKTTPCTFDTWQTLYIYILEAHWPNSWNMEHWLDVTYKYTYDIFVDLNMNRYHEQRQQHHIWTLTRPTFAFNTFLERGTLVGLSKSVIDLQFGRTLCAVYVCSRRHNVHIKYGPPTTSQSMYRIVCVCVYCCALRMSYACSLCIHNLVW